jgi:hypothetical protein
MAKLKRVTVGSVLKSKEAGKGDYLKFSSHTKDALLNAVAKMGEKGLNLRLESKKYQLDSLEQVEKDGKIGADSAAKARERINKIPEFVRFEVILLQEVE